MPRISFHSLQVLRMARDAAVRAAEDAANRGPNALPSDAIVAIVLSASSAEAFINEFAEYVPLIYNLVMDPPAVVANCSAVIKELEESRVPVTVKYLVASQVVGVPFERGSAPFQDFKLLVDLRNAIMHIKVAVEGEQHVGTRIADVLAQRGIAIEGRGTESLPWFDRLMTPAVAKWAHDSALGIIRAFLQLVPVPPQCDPLDMYRESFRNHTPIPG
jgi:hypothetical protein